MFCSRDCTTAKQFVNIPHQVLVNTLYRTNVLYDVFSLEFLTIPWNKALWDCGLIFNCFTYSFIGRYALKVIFENYVNNRKNKLCLFLLFPFFRRKVKALCALTCNESNATCCTQSARSHQLHTFELIIVYASSSSLFVACLASLPVQRTLEWEQNIGAEKLCGMLAYRLVSISLFICMYLFRFLHILFYYSLKWWSCKNLHFEFAFIYNELKYKKWPCFVWFCFIMPTMLFVLLGKRRINFIHFTLVPCVADKLKPGIDYIGVYKGTYECCAA